jgi:hypothetical protein
MKKKRRVKAAKTLLPTHALYPFNDSRQWEAREPRKGGIRFNIGATMIPIAWANRTTRELQNVIDEFSKEVLRRALDGEEEAIQMFAWKTANLVNWLQALTTRQREKVEKVAAISVFWPVNVTQRDPDFTRAKEYVRKLRVGSRSLLGAKPGSRIPRHQHIAYLAERLWFVLLKNRDELPKLLEQAGIKNARKVKTRWISRCLSLPVIRTAQQVTARDAHILWQLGEALLEEAWKQDRDSAFGSLLKDYSGPDAKAENRGMSEEEKEGHLQAIQKRISSTAKIRHDADAIGVLLPEVPE